MDNVCGHRNLTSNNNREMDEIHNCIDDKVQVNEIVISAEFTNEKPCNTEYKQENIYNYVSIKDEDIDNLNILVPGSEPVTDYIADKVCLNETVISGGDIKQEPCDMKDGPGGIHNYLSIKYENIDDPAVIEQETEVMTDCIDNKVQVWETKINGGYIKDEPFNMGDELGSIHNNVYMKGCEECGEEYDLYCLKCPMLIRIFDSNNPDGRDNTVRWTLPKNFLDICETPSGMGIVALRIIPKGVVFGPFKGLDSTKDDAVLKWKLKNKELVYTKDPRWLNWMQYVRIADQDSHRNLIPFQYEGGLYYRSECHINVGDKLLVHWDSDSKESKIQDMEDSYFEPRVCESVDDSYACTFCCVGYKSVSHLKAHNSTCIQKRNKKDFCGDIIQCAICKIYLDKKEYSDYHMDRCYNSNGKCVFKSSHKRNPECSLQYRIHNGNKPFACTLCQFKTMTNKYLQQHIALHSNDKPYACTLCTYKARTNSRLKLHFTIHNAERPFACTLCPYTAKTKWRLKQHVAFHNGDKPFVCTLCSYSAMTNFSLTRHIAVHNGDKPYACTLCPFKATTKENLKQHIVMHSNDKPFACTLCTYKARTNSRLKEHITNHNGERRFACTLCPYTAKTKSALNQHVAFHNSDRPFACTLCPYKTATNWKLKQHIVSHNGDKPFVCTLCPYKTKTKFSLKLHIAVHNGEKPYACTLCPYKTTTKSKLKLHIVIHNDDKPFACALCPYKTKTKGSLKRHIALHKDDNKPSACTICAYKATTKLILKQHVADHHSDRPFACTLCTYKAKAKSALNIHIATHMGDKPFDCPLCPYKGKTKPYLKQHMTIHKDDNKPFACTLCPYKTTTKLILKQHIAVHHSRKPFACTLCTYKAETNRLLKQHVAIHNGSIH